MKEKISSMAIVIGKSKNKNKVLILNNEGEWVFPKGHVENDETYLQTAIRELKEESNVCVSEDDSLGQIDEFKFYFDKEKAIKVIKVFLFKIDYLPLITINKKEGFISGKWIKIEEAIKKLSHDDARESLKKAMVVLNENSK